jgi:hypothetical protein
VNVVDRYVDNRFSSEENRKERGREDLLLFEIKEKKRETEGRRHCNPDREKTTYNLSG